MTPMFPALSCAVVSAEAMPREGRGMEREGSASLFRAAFSSSVEGVSTMVAAGHAGHQRQRVMPVAEDDDG